MEHKEKKRSEPSRKAFEKMAHAITAYLESMGGMGFVIGGVSIQDRPPLKYNYRLCIDITGKKPTKTYP